MDPGWERDGYFLVRGFADPSVCRAMLSRVVELSRQAGGAGAAGDALVLPEANLRSSVAAGAPAEQRVSKVFRLHRDPVFRDFATREDLLARVRPILGPDVDCFLSQFIFKNPGAWGQPWHQDSYYFHFDRSPQVGVWLAVSEATRENGCLHVLPGSHREPVHAHVPDRRPHANVGYVEIVDHDMGEALPVMMEPGDLLVFHSHLMHCSRDNTSSGHRAAMVYHYASHGTVDRDRDTSPVNDWMPIPKAAATP